MSAVPPPFGGNINFNAQHSPMGAFMSFTCGHFGSGGGIGIEIGRPATQSIYVGVKKGTRRSNQPIRCLPFAKSGAAGSGANFQVENSTDSPGNAGASVEFYSPDQITRRYGWASDRWDTEDFSFTIYTPFGPIPEPGTDSDTLRESLLPAVVVCLEVDNRSGSEPKTAVFGIDFAEAGARLLQGGDAWADGPAKLGFAWRRSMGVLGMVEGSAAGSGGGLLALQRWSLAEALIDVNPAHGLGTSAGLALEVAAGSKRTMVLAIGAHLDGVVTTRLEGRYYYTRFYSSLDEVLAAALQQSADLRLRSALLDAELLSSGLSTDQQFLIAHATRSYYGNTQLLDVGGEPFWIVNEGEYCMMNTLDLSVDQVFWELQHNPWVVRNVLTNFVRHYAYHDQVKTRGGQVLPGGISFAHDMGVNNGFSAAGQSSYELANLTGCFSYMTQEELCNWILMAVCYVARTGDTRWLLENGHVIAACADSLRCRANLRTGMMAHDSTRCGTGQEITTYDSLDESLGQARANTYLATKCWATWIGLDLLARLRSATGAEDSSDTGPNLADDLADFLVRSATAEGTLPAVLEKDNPGFHSRILPVVEALIYPAYWLGCLQQHAPAQITEPLRRRWSDPLIDLLRRHTLALLTDPGRPNLFPDGGIKLSSSSNNSWMSKIAMFQFVCRAVLRLTDAEPRIADIFAAADAAHVSWQTLGCGHWACSDQFVSGRAKGSRYYPRVITAALWLDEKSAARLKPAAERVPQ